MIVVRDVFQLRFRKAKEALAHFKEGRPIFERLGMSLKNSRLLTDLTGPFYTPVLESTFGTLADFEKLGQSVMGDAKWHAWYAKFTPLCEGGHREIFSVVEER